MTAALTGLMLGLKVKILEKSEVIGGTTSLSAGSVWIPNSMHSTPGADSDKKKRGPIFARPLETDSNRNFVMPF